MSTLTPAEFARAMRRLGGTGRASVSAAVSKVARNTSLYAERVAKEAVTLGGSSGLRVRTGLLRSSIAGRVLQDPGSMSVVLSAGGRRRGRDVVYARIHELGGEAGRVSARVRIPARPYLRPAIDKVGERLPERMGKAVTAAVRAAERGGGS
jgi:phage gpG-like protein